MRFSRKPLVVLAVVGTVIALPALAQLPASPYPPGCEGSKVSKSDVERAHTVFLSGKQFLEESNYEKAISYFKDAYSIDCSIHAILPIIATAYERKGDKGEAVRALEEYQRRAPSAPDHEVIERRIRNLKDQLARDQPAPATATAAPTAVPLAAPSASAAAAPTVTAEPTPTAVATSSNGSEAPAPTGGHSVAPWVAVGVGGALVIAGVAMYAAGAGDVSTASGECGPTRMCSSASAAALGNKGRSLETLGVVSGTVGLASVVAGIVAHFVEKTGGPPGTSTGTQVSPVVAPGYAGLALGGAF
jgi:hypothetical protein